MAERSVHAKKRKKNIAVFLLILGWCLLIFLVTMVKLAQAHDTADTFIGQRQKHLQDMTEDKESYDRHATEKYFPEFYATAQKMEEAGVLHQQDMADARESYDRHWVEKYSLEYQAASQKMEDQGEKHRDGMELNPGLWWENWEDKLNPEK